MFFLLYKYTDGAVFDDFPKISDHFPKISEDFPKLSRRPDERSRKFRGRPEDPKMFRWYTNEFKYNLRDILDIPEVIDIFTCEDIMSSHVRISYRFYQFVTTRYTTDFYIINMSSFLVFTLFSLFELKATIEVFLRPTLLSAAMDHSSP